MKTKQHIPESILMPPGERELLKSELMQALESVDIPKKQINCYGSQIVVTCWSQDAAEKWVNVLNKFATVRGVIKTVDEATLQKMRTGLVMKSNLIDVWRVYARI